MLLNEEFPNITDDQLAFLSSLACRLTSRFTFLPLSKEFWFSLSCSTDLPVVQRPPLAKLLCPQPFFVGNPIFLESHWAAIVQCRVKPPMIIEAEPVDHLVFGLTTPSKAHSMEPFGLHRTKVRFCHDIVPAIALALHRASNAEGRELLLEISAGVLAASVRMKDQAGCWPSAEPSHAQCVDDQASCHALAHCNADNLTTEQIDDDGEIDRLARDLAFFRGKVKFMARNSKPRTRCGDDSYRPAISRGGSRS
jgi:hypothetical protein